MMGIFFPSWLSQFTVFSGWCLLISWGIHIGGHLLVVSLNSIVYLFATETKNKKQHGTEPHALEWSNSRRPSRIEMGPLRIHLTHFYKNPCFSTLPWSSKLDEGRINWLMFVKPMMKDERWKVLFLFSSLTKGKKKKKIKKEKARKRLLLFPTDRDLRTELLYRDSPPTLY